MHHRREAVAPRRRLSGAIFRRLAGLFGVWVFWGCSVLFAQPELILKLSESASSEVLDGIQTSASKTATLTAADLAWADTALTAALVGIRSTLGPRGGASKQGSTPALGRIFTLAFRDSSSLGAAIEAWSDRPEVEYAIANRRYRLSRVEGVTAGATTAGGRVADLRDSLLHLDQIRAPEAWALTRGDPDVRIGFVDTGVYFEHPDLVGRFWINPGEDIDGDGRFTEADLDGVDTDGNGYIDDVRGYDFVHRPLSAAFGDVLDPDPDAAEDLAPMGEEGRGHGTLIAGVLGAADEGAGVVGVAPRASLVPLRAFGIDGVGEDDDVARAIVYAADLGLEVLNLSFGDAYFSPLMRDAIAYAVASGTVVVASGGNDGGDWPHYPSDYPEVISVGWLSSDAQNRGFRASHGINLDLSAPGTEVFTTLLPPVTPQGTVIPGDSLLYGRRSGASLASPQVAGAAALLRSVHPNLRPASVREILATTARDLDQVGWLQGWDQFTGAGLLDVAAALGQPLPARVEITSPAAGAGLRGPSVDLRGTVLSPLFESYSLHYATGDDEPDGRWERITEAGAQVSDGLLGSWDLAGLPDTTYVLRLSVRLKSGKRIEDRRRVYLDRTPPEVSMVFLGPAVRADRHGVFLDAEIDDVSSVDLVTVFEGRKERVASDRLGKRHGVFWSDQAGRGGDVLAWVEAVNRSGDTTSTAPVMVRLPNWSAPEGVLSATPLGIPAGYPVETTMDLDGDGLRELALTRLEDNALGDTLLFYEWSGSGFARRDTSIIAPLIPRDVADTDRDGLQEILLQRSGYTAVIEQMRPHSLLFQLVYEDTVGLTRPDDEQALWGGRFADLDGDGLGEILGHNRSAWRVLEANRNGFEEVLRIQNPTPEEEARSGELTTDANGFTVPVAETGDFDGDGETDLLLGDFDGDWFILESTGNDRLELRATHTAGAYAFANRFQTIDVDRDGRDEFVTFTESWRTLRLDREYEPAYGVYVLWGSTGEDTYTPLDSLVVVGPVNGASDLGAGDLDGDGFPELLVAHAPNGYVLDWEGRWRVSGYVGRKEGPGLEEDRQGPAAAIRSSRIVVDDVDLDGRDEAVIAMQDNQFYLWRWKDGINLRPPPRWSSAHALDAGRVRLAWSSEADSVTVYATDEDLTFDPIDVLSADTLDLASTRERRYALRAWYGGEGSVLSEARRVRPHDPARVTDVTFEMPWVRIRFSEPLTSIGADRIALASGRPIDGIVQAENGRRLLLRVESERAGPDTLVLRGVRDIEGTPVQDNAIPLVFPGTRKADLVLLRWDVVDPGRVELTFNQALDGSTAQDTSHYRLDPGGRVVKANWQANRPEMVELVIEGRAVGAVGIATTLYISGLVGADGSGLSDAGSVALLVQAAQTLSDVFIFPNPYRAVHHAARVMIAGIPTGASVEIFSLDGRPVRSMKEENGDGGISWDLKTGAGREAPSGVYLVRVESLDGDAVTLKLALIR